VTPLPCPPARSRGDYHEDLHCRSRDRHHLPARLGE
jgi:hypothetical protein